MASPPTPPTKDQKSKISLDIVFKRRQQLVRCKLAGKWIGIDLLIFVIIFADLLMGSLGRFIVIQPVKMSVTSVEVMIGFVVAVHALYSIYWYMWPSLCMQPIKVTLNDMRLLGIKKGEIGFQEYDPNAEQTTTSPSPPSKPTSPSLSKTLPFDASVIATYYSSSGPNTDISSASLSRISSPSSPYSGVSSNASPNYSMNSSSWAYLAGRNSGVNPNSFSSASNAGTPSSAGMGEGSFGVSLRKRIIEDRSPITDEASLNTYLEKCKEQEEKLKAYKEVEARHQLESSMTGFFNLSQ